jgi:hypothetical protein
MALEIELQYFERQKTDWLKTHAGKFVLIKGEQLSGVFDSDAAAFQAGVALFGAEPFLVKQVVDNEPVQQFPALYAGVLSGIN